MMNMNTPSTYQELFEDPATDPCRTRADDNPAEALTALYARWRVGLAGVPERLYNDILVDFAGARAVTRSVKRALELSGAETYTSRIREYDS